MKVYKLYFNETNEVSYQMGSSFHGFIFTNINEKITDELHQDSSIFTQFVTSFNGQSWWQIALFNEAYETYFDALLCTLNEVALINPSKVFTINKMEIVKVSTEQFIKDSIFKFKKGRVYLETLTPNSFKINGSYMIFPSVEHIIKNAVRFFNLSMPGYEITETSVIDEIIETTKITSYRLKSTPFYIESARIQGYMGEFLMSSRTMYPEIYSLIFSFLLYRGSGIKTRVGMGALKLKEERNE